MRSFIAIPLPDATVAALERLQEALPAGRSVDGENLHLTLCFLEDRHDFELAALHETLSGIRASAPRIRLSGIDLAGGRKPRLIWMKAEPDQGLVALHEQVMRAVRAAGIDLPRRRFRPHVTLARFGAAGAGGGDMARLRQFLLSNGAARLPAFHPVEFALFRSHLRADGAVYERLETYPLAPPIPPT